jgi:transposase-like protein
MAEAAIRCPHCQSEAVMKYGKASKGKERFRCQQTAQCGRTFLRSYAYPGCLPTVKQQIVEMTLNGSGIRDIVRVLQVGPNTVLKELKKSVWPLVSKHQRGERVLSGCDHSRSAPRGGGRGG